jgi:ATP-binding cassette subfamily F protein 3
LNYLIQLNIFKLIHFIHKKYPKLILYVEQIEEHSDNREISVIDAVLAADVEAIKLKQGLNMLQVASSRDNQAGIRALQTI